MSIATDHRAALLLHAPLSAILTDGRQFAISAVGQGVPAPYIVMTSREAPEYGLFDNVLGNDISFEYQCWADTAVGAAALADALAGAIAARTDAVMTSRADGYDEETQRDAVVLTAQLLVT